MQRQFSTARTPLGTRGVCLPACCRARFRPHSDTPFLTEKQDTGKEATICKQMPKDELLPLKSRSGLIRNPTNEAHKRRGLETHVSLQKIRARLSLPKRLLPHNLQAVTATLTEIFKMPFSCESCAQGCLTAARTWSSGQPRTQGWPCRSSATCSPPSLHH